MKIVAELISKYNLQPHPEGGWYTQTYKSSEEIPAGALPERFTGSRPFSTAIYFLLEKGNFSAFHKIKSDECWHFYAGDPLEIFIINPDGNLLTVILGNDFKKDRLFQFIVPANCWFAGRTAAGGLFSFVGCTVSPGFKFEDFEIADKSELLAAYPKHNEIISQLCR